jgi:thioredoxin-related protein
LIRYGLLITQIFLVVEVSAQAQKEVQWISFEQLDDSLLTNPKPVFIDFYTSWCTYCRKMDKKVFTNSQVIEKLNRDYYAIKFDAETSDTVKFDGGIFINDQVDKSRTPFHQIVQLLAMREDIFTPPTMVILDESFLVEQRIFSYLNSKQLLYYLE